MMRQRTMQTTTHAPPGLLDCLMIATPTSKSLERLNRALDWPPVETTLPAMDPAPTGRPPCAPRALFQMSLLQHCQGLADPQCEELVSWRCFVGVGLQHIVRGDEEMVRADNADWSRERREWCGRHGIVSGILRKPSRGQKLRPASLRVNRLLSRLRGGIERIFGWWKRCTAWRRVRYVAHDPNRLELEFKSVCWNLKRLVSLQPA